MTETIENGLKRVVISNDLKQLALAVHSYHDTYGRFPSAAVYDKDGKPLLSWRVQILPYIEQEELYKQFHLDEPWDSEHNKKLLDKMPTTFAPENSEAFKKHETFFQGFAGKGSVFGGKAGPMMSDIAALNGTSNTILFVEAAKSVPWTKPEDIALDEGKLLPKLGGLSKDGFLAAFCDGSVRFLPLTIDEKDLRRTATYTNTEPFSLDK